MDFQTFCSTWFKGNEQKAIRQLIWEAEAEKYRRSGSRDGLQAILATMTREQTELYRQMTAQWEADKQKESKYAIWIAIAIAVMMLGGMIWMLVSGWSNLMIRRELQENGVPVTVTVTGKERVSSGENDDYKYTFTYDVEGSTYTFVGSADRVYDVGDTFREYIDPRHPEQLVLVSDNLPGFFMLVGIFLAFPVLMPGKHRVYFLAALMGLWGFMVAVGVLLAAKGYMIIGGILFALTLLGLLILITPKKASGGASA